MAHAHNRRTADATPWRPDCLISNSGHALPLDVLATQARGRDIQTYLQMHFSGVLATSLITSLINRR